MATLLQTVNRVLRRLREDEVSTVAETEYSILVGDFVADAVLEVAEAHPWEALRHKVTVDLSAGTYLYDLTRTVANGGNVRNSTAVAKADSELQYTDHNMPEVYLFDDDSDEDYEPFIWTTPEVIRRLRNMDRDDTDQDPTYISVYPSVDSSGTTRLYMQVYPAPTTARVVEASFWTAPDELETDGTDDSTVITLPERPVRLLALMYALNERGEEIGEPGNLAERRYFDALGAAIEKDIAGPQRGDRYDWRRD